MKLILHMHVCSFICDSVHRFFYLDHNLINECGRVKRKLFCWLLELVSVLPLPSISCPYKSFNIFGTHFLCVEDGDNAYFICAEEQQKRPTAVS
jgi:hypothetical protein